jgi:uncharacterized protein YciI
MGLERFSFVLLRRGPKADEFSEAELERLQEAHLTYLAEMRKRRLMAVAGPFSEQPDETLRGFCLYTVELDEARRLAESDPSVQAGRMAVDVFNWWTQKGAIAFPAGSPRTD